MARPRSRLGAALTLAADWLVAQIAFALIGLVRRLPPDRIGDLFAAVTTRLAPLLPVNRVAAANIARAFPEKSEAERAAILRQSWDNLARIAAEFPHLDHLLEIDLERTGAGRLEVDGVERFLKLRDDGQPAIIFAAHLANWELPAACAARYGLDTTVLFQPPHNVFIGRYIEKVRGKAMGKLVATRSRTAPLGMAATLAAGGHLGILVDQRYRRGIRGPVFGHTAWISTVVARLARQFDCPVHGVRAIRLPRGRFRIELTEEIALPRAADGAVDVERASLAVSAVVEDWIREHPGQWLWQHARWAE